MDGAVKVCPVTCKDAEMLKEICAVIDCSKDESMHRCPRKCGEEYEKFHHHHDHEDVEEEGKIYYIKKSTILKHLKNINNEIQTNNVLAHIFSEKPALDPSQQPYSKQNIWLQVSGKAKPTYGYKEQGDFHSL